MFDDVATFQFVAPSAAFHKAYLWRPGSEKPIAALFPYSFPICLGRTPIAHELLGFLADSAVTRFSAYIVFGIFGATSAYSSFFQYLSYQSSQPDDTPSSSLPVRHGLFSSGDTEIDLGVSFYAFLCCVLLSIVAHVVPAFFASLPPTLPQLRNIYLIPAFLFEVAALTTMVLGIGRMGASLNMSIDGDFLRSEIEQIPGILAKVELGALAFVMLAVLISSGAAIKQIFTMPVHSSRRAGGLGRGSNGIPVVSGQLLGGMGVNWSTPTCLPQEDAKSAAFFLTAWDKYGGAVQHLLKEPRDIFTLSMDVQAQIFMRMCEVHCGPGEWLVYGSPDSAELSCATFLQLAARWHEAAEQLRKTSRTKFTDRSMAHRVRSLLVLEKVFEVTRKVEPALGGPATEAESDLSAPPAAPLPGMGATVTGAVAGATGSGALTTCVHADIAACGALQGEPSASLRRTKAQLPSGAPDPSGASGSNVTIDIAPALPTTQPTETSVIVPSSPSENQPTGGDPLSGSNHFSVGTVRMMYTRGIALGSASTVHASPPSHATDRVSFTGAEDCSAIGTTSARSGAGRTSPIAGEDYPSAQDGTAA